MDADSSSQTTRVVFALREKLVRGEFHAGERLAELTLVPLLGASRTPVRLALERLAHDGLLEPLPGGGFRVRSFTVADIWDAIEIRGVMEGTAARFAAERSVPADLRTLQECCREVEELVPMTLDDFVRYLDVNDRFHRELWRLAKSPMLLRAIEAAIALPFAAPGALVFGATEAMETGRAGVIALEHHRALVDAIEHREGARAEALAREHSRVARRNLERAMNDQALFEQLPGAALIRASRA